MSDIFKVGDILRYAEGPTALMRVTYVRVGHGGSKARYYGQQCMGGSCGAYHEQVTVATDEDIKTWFKIGREKDIHGHPLWRKPWRLVKKRDRRIVGVVED